MMKAAVSLDGQARRPPPGDGPSPPPSTPPRDAPPVLDERAIAVWRKIGLRPSPLEEVPSDATTTVLQLIVQDAESRRVAGRDEQTTFAWRLRYYARRFGTVLAESERKGDTPEQRLARLLADPYVARVTPELTAAEVELLTDNAPSPNHYRDPADLKRALAAGPPSELATLSVRDRIPPPGKIAGFTTTPDRPLAPENVAEGQRVLLFFDLVGRAPPTWNLDRLLEAYNDIVLSSQGKIEALPMSRDELDLLLTEAPWVREEYERYRFNFRGTLKSVIADAPVGRSLGDVLRDICRYNAPSTPGYELDVPQLLDYVRGDSELSRVLGEKLGTSLLGEHAAVLPRLARWVKRVYGDDLHAFSLLEISDRMQREDSAFTPSLVAELFVRCPDILGAAPEADTRRNFLLAVTVATTMQKMWDGATYEDVVGFLAALGPHGDVPPGFSVEHLRLLQGYDFVPVWPDGVKRETRAEVLDRQLGELASVLREPLKLLRGGLDEHVRQEAAAMLASRALPDKKRIAALIESTYRPTVVSKAVALMERYGGGLNMEVVNHLVEQLSAGRYDELLENPVWRTAFRPARGSDFDPAGKGVPDALFGLIRDFRDAERRVADGIELAVYRRRAATAAMDNVEKIPRVLPITQKTVTQIQDDFRARGKPLPFSNARVVMIQHELGQAYPQVEAYRALGMDAAKCTFVGKPYHPNPAVEHALLQVSGVDGRFAQQGDLETMHAMAQQAVDEAISKRAPGEVVLVVGDGPQIRRYVEDKHFKANPELARFVRFTEQTAIGHRERDVQASDKRVVSFARLYQKLVEAPYIGRAGRRAVEAVMVQLRDTIENKTIWVNGIAGPIGRAAAEALQAAGARIMGWDPNVTAETRAWAKELGIDVFDSDEHLPEDVFAVAGAAGATSIDRKQIDKTKRRRDGGPVYYISFSSERVEVDYPYLQERSTVDGGVVRKMVAATVNDQPTYYYWFDDGTVRAVPADTLPINFQDVNSVAPEAIDATIALSVAAGAEAMMSDELGFFAAARYVGVVEEGYSEYIVRAGGSLPPASR